MNLLVIDGNSILNRAFYGIKLLTTKDGRFTNGIYGFLTIFLKLREECSPDAIAVAFDKKGPTFRHELYKEYKAHRKGMPEELAQQLPVLKQLLTALGITVVEAQGWEADDILGTAADFCAAEDTCYIATGDRDSLQLVRDNVRVLLASTQMGRPVTIRYDRKAIEEEYGVTPAQLIDIKALMGDSSDNIPGVPGVGKKTAAELIARFGSLEVLYDSLDAADIKPGIRQKLADNKDLAFLSRELGTIRTDAPITRSTEAYIPAAPDAYEVTRLMAELEMFKLLERLDLKPDESALKTDREEEITSTLIYVADGDPATVAQALEKTGRAYILPVYAAGEISDLYMADERTVTHLNSLTPGFAQFIQSLLESPKTDKYTYDIKSLHTYCLQQGLVLAGNNADIMLTGYVLNPNAGDYEPERLAKEYAVQTPVTDTEDPMALRVSLLPKLFEALGRMAEENGQTALIERIELPLAGVLAAMEYEGFAVDKQGLLAFGAEVQTRLDTIESEIYGEVGYAFNLNSPKQLGEALFVKLGLPTKKKTKTGFSTNAEVLESLRYEHPVIERILEHRMLAKLKSTYCDGLVKVIGADGRIHSTFRQTETRTGRLSSTEPNLQNIPIRSELGRELRRFFRAGEGRVLADADYSQIELRVLAHIAEDEAMITAFNDHLDIHTITASQVFNLPLDMVSPAMRGRAKAVNFGIVYGIGAFSLAKDIGVPIAEADRYIKGYLNHYVGVREYMKRVVEFAKTNGYVETVYKRRRYLPELASSNAVMRAFGERVARNMPIQGTAADIIKIAMVRVYERLNKEGLQAKLIMQVHDELIVEAPEDEIDTVCVLLKEEMERAADMCVTLTADVHKGKTWYEAKG